MGRNEEMGKDDRNEGLELASLYVAVFGWGKDRSHPLRGRHQANPGRGYSRLSLAPYKVHEIHMNIHI